MSEQAERRVGTIIGGKWRVDALLGSGSMAAVYAVTHRNGARAALKILHPTLCTDPAVCERFLGEGYLANSVKHSGIVRVLDDGVTDDGCVFLTMDLLEGDTLEAHRQKRGNRVPIVEALDLGDKLMDVLSAVHAAGIIHRDLKPQNVFVCDDGVLKLLDFGVARVFDRTSQSKLSMFGLVLGTPSFMSPEQALGSRDKVDHRSDIWSFGATLFTVLTGETVHLGANVQAKLLAAATVKARSIAMVMPELPPAIAAAIDMALRFKKEDRWQSVDVMRRSFREARDNSGLGRAAEPARPYDMSLDESTHVDKGGPSQVPAPFASSPPAPYASGPPSPYASSPPPLRSQFDGERTQRMESEPPEGPSGTFIGIGSKDGRVASVVGSDGSVPRSIPPPPAFLSSPPKPVSARPSYPPPATGRPRMPSNAGNPGTPGIPIPLSSPLPGVLVGEPRGARGPSSAPNPAAIVRRMPTPDPVGFRSSRPDSGERQEGSIPAYGNTLSISADESYSDIDPRELGMRPKSTVAVWLMAVLLAAAALGGIAFFAVKRGPLADLGRGEPGNPSIPATATTSATLTPPPQTTLMLPSTTGLAPATAPSEAGVTTREAGTPTPTVVTPTPPVRTPSFPFRPPGTSGGHAPRSPSRPTPPTGPTSADPPKPPAGLAPDPFGTPE